MDNLIIYRNYTLTFNMNRFSLYLITCFIANILFVSTTNSQFLGLPVWPLVTGFEQSGPTQDLTSTTLHQYVIWNSSTPIAMDIPSGSSNKVGPSHAGVNECGELVFFTLHNGDFNAATAELNLYDAGGNQIIVTGGEMNASAGDDEIQVVLRPGSVNQWFFIYNLAPSSYPSTSPGYQASYLAYSLVEVMGTTAQYISDGSGPIKDRLLDVGGTTYQYFPGKATSASSFVGNHDIYAQRRDQAFGSTVISSTFEVDKFVIDTSKTIAHAATSSTVSSYSWSLMAAGSPIELDPNSNQLLVMARSQNNNQQEAYLFDVSSPTAFAALPTTIKFSELLIDFDSTISVSGSLSQYHAPMEFDISTGTGFDWLRNMERKIVGVEFSPSGDYLYFCGGGYQSSGNSNLSYLGQIDLTTSGPNYITRLQVQTSDPLNSYNSTTGTGPTWSSSNYTNLWLFHPTAKIQTCYDGNMYFTKGRSSDLFVLPDPDALMPINLTPHDIDFSTPSIPNISTNGYANNMPDQIDGYDYFDCGGSTSTAEHESTTIAIELSPVPANDRLQIKLDSKVRTEYGTLQIVDLNGKLLFTGAFIPQIGTSSHDINVSTLGSGVYLLTIECHTNSGIEHKTIRFIKQ